MEDKSLYKASIIFYALPYVPKSKKQNSSIYSHNDKQRLKQTSVFLQERRWSVKLSQYLNEVAWWKEKLFYI